MGQIPYIQQERGIEEVPKIHRPSGPETMKAALADMKLSAAEVMVGFMKGTLSSAGTTPSGKFLSVDVVKAGFHYDGFITQENATIEARVDLTRRRVAKISDSDAWQNGIKQYATFLLTPAVELALRDLNTYFRPFLEPGPKKEDEVLEDAPQPPRESRSPPQGMRYNSMFEPIISNLSYQTVICSI